MEVAYPPWPHRESRGWTSGKAGHRLRETFWVLSLHPVRMETQAQLKRDLQKRLPLPPKSSEPLPTRALDVALVATLPSFLDPEERTGAGQAQRPSCHRGFVSPPISCPAPGLQEQPSLQTGGVSAAGTAPRLHFEGVLGARVMYVTEAVNGRDGPWQRELGQSLWGPGLQGGGAAWSS